MPQINETKMGREIGKIALTQRFIWASCIDCGKERWVRYSVKKKQSYSPRCGSCAHRFIQQEVRDGIRPKPQMTLERHKRLSESKMGNKNPQYKKYGELNSAWKGGRHHNDGYIHVWIPPDDFFLSMAGVNRMIPEHRLIMAKSLGRCLFPWEVVHHKNGIRDDNRLENLELITDRRFHMVDAASKSYIKRLERTIEQLEERIKVLEQFYHSITVAR